jgi:hypothetical protein
MITVYLDTSDYSNMSNPKKMDERLTQVKKRLIDFSLKGDVKFVFSVITVGEMMPLRHEDAQRCLMTAKLVRELCGNHCLTSWDQLLKQELAFVCGTRSEPCQPHGLGGIWIPGLEVSHPTRGELVQLAGKHANAESRISATIGSFDWVISSFGSATDITMHYRDNLRWLGQKVSGHMKNFVEHAVSSPKKTSREKWTQNTGVFALKLAESFSEHFGLSPTIDVSPVDVDDIDRCCPGLAAMTRANMEFLWTYIGGHAKKEISSSAYPDAQHAMYAPYVDIFRADQTMAPHVKTAMQLRPTKIVARLLDLPDAIEECVAARSR